MESQYHTKSNMMVLLTEYEMFDSGLLIFADAYMDSLRHSFKSDQSFLHCQRIQADTYNDSMEDLRRISGVDEKTYVSIARLI